MADDEIADYLTAEQRAAVDAGRPLGPENFEIGYRRDSSGKLVMTEISIVRPRRSANA